MRADTLTEGMLIDLEPFALTWGDGADILAAEYEYATVEDVLPAEPVEGGASVIVCTDLGNYKVPASYEVEVA